MPAPELRQTILVSSACLLLGAACGWWLRGDSAPGVLPVENATLEKKNAAPQQPAPIRESSTDEDSPPTPLPFATAIRASLADRDPLSRGIRIREIIRNLSAADLPAAVAEVDRLHRNDSWQGMEMLGWQWAQSDPSAAIEFAKKSRDFRVGHIGASVLQGAIENLSDRDPAAAAHFLDQMLNSDWPGSEARGRATGLLLGKWMDLDPSASNAWVQRLPKDALSHAMDYWIQQNGKSALDWLSRAPFDSNQESPLSNAFFHWAQFEAPEDAVNWALAQSDDKIRAAVLPTAILGLADVDPTRAAKLFAEHNQTDPDPKMPHRIAGAWAKKNPLAAALWVQTLPQDDRESGYGSVGRYWPQNDAAGATKWLQALPVGRERDAAVAGFVGQVVERDPIGAIEWVKTIGNESARKDAFISVGARWMEYEPAAAKEWIQATDLIPAARKQDLIERRRNSR